MEKVLLFSRPLGFDYDPDDQNESEIRKLAYGIQMTGIGYNHYDLNGYLEYLVAAQKWDALGNDVVLDTWTTKEGASYGTFDAEIQKFIEQANRELPVSADIYDIEFDVSEGVINYFLVDAALAERIKGEGHLADVIKPQYGDETQGE